MLFAAWLSCFFVFVSFVSFFYYEVKENAMRRNQLNNSHGEDPLLSRKPTQISSPTDSIFFNRMKMRIVTCWTGMKQMETKSLANSHRYFRWNGAWTRCNVNPQRKGSVSVDMSLTWSAFHLTSITTQFRLQLGFHYGRLMDRYQRWLDSTQLVPYDIQLGTKLWATQWTHLKVQHTQFSPFGSVLLVDYWEPFEFIHLLRAWCLGLIFSEDSSSQCWFGWFLGNDSANGSMMWSTSSDYWTNEWEVWSPSRARVVLSTDRRPAHQHGGVVQCGADQSVREAP